MVSGPMSCSVVAPVTATGVHEHGFQESQDCQSQDHSVGDQVEIILDPYDDCSPGDQLLVVGENDICFILEGGKMISKGDEFAVWKWVDEPDSLELGRQESKCSNNSNDQYDVSPIARKLTRAISSNSLPEVDTVADDDHWRFTEDMVMQALLKHWGNGSFEPTQHGNISARRDLENSLRGALAAALRSCPPQHKLSRQETSALFAAWADSLYGGVHDGKPMVTLGETTMCLRNLIMCW